MYDIKTVEDLITLLGGPTKIGDWLGVSQESVSFWKRRGIPAGWHLRLFAEVGRRGKTVAPNVFGMTETDAEPLLRMQRLDRDFATRDQRHASYGP